MAMENYGRRNMKNVERDAYRFIEARLDYGKGAGTKRKLIAAELEPKMQDDAYKAAFNDAINNIDVDRVIRSIERRKAFENTYHGAQKTVNTARRIGTIYANNKSWIDKILDFIFGSMSK